MDKSSDETQSDSQMINTVVQVAERAWQERRKTGNADIKHYKTRPEYKLIVDRYPIVLYFIVCANMYSSSAFMSYIQHIMVLTKDNHYWWKDEKQFISSQTYYITKLYQSYNISMHSKSTKRKLLEMEKVIAEEYENVQKAYSTMTDGDKDMTDETRLGLIKHIKDYSLSFKLRNNMKVTSPANNNADECGTATGSEVFESP